MHYISESKMLIDAMVKNSHQTDYPLLLLYGENDMIVDKAGCEEIYSAWKGQKKKYEITKGGSHGKSTVLKGAEIILKWIYSL
jgi:predicted esterase